MYGPIIKKARGGECGVGLGRFQNFNSPNAACVRDPVFWKALLGGYTERAGSRGNAARLKNRHLQNLKWLHVVTCGYTWIHRLHTPNRVFTARSVGVMVVLAFTTWTDRRVGNPYGNPALERVSGENRYDFSQTYTTYGWTPPAAHAAQRRWRPPGPCGRAWLGTLVRTLVARCQNRMADG